MSKPIIALTASWNMETLRMILNQDYIHAVADAGGVPIVLPCTTDEEGLRSALDHADGLLLTGGADIDPSLYGEETLPCCGTVTRIRDDTELVLIRHALEKKMPILGICRGFEILNAALGGTLYQDIEQQYGSAVSHPRYDIPGGDAHTVQYLEGTLLKSIMGEEKGYVNSRHHQGVKEPAAGLKICAQAPDGLTEGLEAEDGRPILAVQWHPESLYQRLPVQRRIFQWLIRAASR